jgi:phosphatidylglycerol:prolipoprotein diacylglycerol transferase
MFINNINPVLLRIGPFDIRYYGLVYVIGFILGYLFLRYNISKKKLKLSYDQLDSYFLWLIIGSIIMARLFDIFIYSWPDYANDLSQIYMIWNGGLAFQGGLIGAIIVTILFCKKYKIHFYDIADLLVIPTAFALVIGKLANYTNSELYGRITDSQSTPWCVVFKRIDDYCRHPTQIYESIANFVMFGILSSYYIYHEKVRKTYRKGTIFWTFVLTYSILRFIVTFYRDELLYTFLGISLNVGQWVSLVIIVVSCVFLWKLWKIKPKTI